MRNLEVDEWKQAMIDEFASILANDTWEIVERPEDRRAIGNRRIVLRNKYGVDGQIVRRKARVVVRGFSQRHGTDYSETFAPVVRLGFVRLAVALAAKHGIEIRQFDVTTA